MDFNLSALLDATNSKFEQPLHAPVKFHLTEDGWILAKMGEVAYFFNYKKLRAVLDGNNFDHYHKEDTQEKINELLSRHIINQVTAGRGKKIYPEIKTVKGDPNNWD